MHSTVICTFAAFEMRKVTVNVNFDLIEFLTRKSKKQSTEVAYLELHV